jgi:prefoldin subunit 5
MARKQQIADVKALANTLVLLRKENILKFSDFDSKLEDLRGKRKEIKEDIKKLDIKNTAYKEVAKYLVAYNKNLPVFEEYQKKLFGNKTFYKKHESEIRIFEHAKNRLEEMKINTNVNSEKVVAVVKSQNKDIYNLEADFKKIDNRINDLSSARKTVENILLGSPDDKKKSRGREEERD